MSSAPALGLRTLAFGDLQSGIWGAAVGCTDAVVAVGSFDSGAPLSAVPVRLEGSAGDAAWELTGPALRLLVIPREATPSEAAGVQLAQLCGVSGTALVDGTEREVDCVGLRSCALDVDLRALDSVRQVLTWFAPDDGIAVCSRRPRGAKGHDRDVVAAVVLEPDGPIPVADGRLSTTYAGSGVPARLGLELWLTEEEDQFPLRVSGEATGIDADGTTADVVVELHAFCCHSRGRDGSGAYLVTRPA